MSKKANSTKATSKRKKYKLPVWEKKFFSWALLKEEKALLLIAFLIFILTFINYFESQKAPLVVIVYPEVSNQVQEKTVDDIQADLTKSDKNYNWQSFGDNFSSYAYLNSKMTSMYLDETVTALTFPPVYEFKTNDCVEDCDFNDFENAIYLQNKEGIYLKDLALLPKPLPMGLQDKEIVEANLNNFGTVHVASFVIKKDSQEQAFFYFLENGEYKPIITDETKEKIITKYGKLGGFSVAGGDSDSFIMLYMGYEAHAYYYSNGQIENISNFFSLRVSAGDFRPYIIKQGQGGGAVWYITNSLLNNPKLIKLWQNNTEHIRGSYDISEKINETIGSQTIIGVNNPKRYG